MFFHLDSGIGGSNKKKGGAEGGSLSSKKRVGKIDVSSSKKTKQKTNDVGRLHGV